MSNCAIPTRRCRAMNSSPPVRLSVSLAPPPVLEEECPVVGGGGYLGFEHHLYRIEVADGDPLAPARFKWSPWNGGLVGRGVFDTTPPDGPGHLCMPTQKGGWFCWCPTKAH